ncbi:MAG: RNA polymerase sigma-70 factor, partial [Pedobacter sp.]
HVTYYAPLLHYAWTIVHDKELAKDFVQEAFVSYWNHIDEITGDLNYIRNFLYMQVKNAGLKHLRHEKVVDKYISRQDRSEPSEEAAAHTKLIQSEVIVEIYAAIESLPEACKRISKMAYLDGLKNQEVADKLGISINTVKTQKKIAMKLLKVKLKPESLLTLIAMERFFDQL